MLAATGDRKIAGPIGWIVSDPDIIGKQYHRYTGWSAGKEGKRQQRYRFFPNPNGLIVDHPGFIP